MKSLSSCLLLGSISLVFTLFIPQSARAVSLVNSLTLAGDAVDLTDLNGGSGGANINRLGYFSDLYYDRINNVYYGLSDRGPGGGTIAYNTRVQKFSLDVDLDTGSISNFKLLETIAFTKNGQNFNGLNPLLLNGDNSNLGLSFDPEGFVLAPNGNFYISDEYGASVYEFAPNGEFIRAIELPINILPQAGTTPNYVDGRGIITSGRQDNRGFEGITMSPDGSKLYAMLQDPLVNEGNGNDGRLSRNLRIVEFDTQTGQSTAQYIYQLDDLTAINDRIAGTDDDFSSTSQGRSIGISSIVALNDREFLVLERDNRGLGIDDPTASEPVGSKRVYQISLDGATDVSNLSLSGTSTLPTSINPVNKIVDPFIDIAATLQDLGLTIPAKLEGLTIGPKLNDGSYGILLGTDNDYSVTQDDTDEQADVCSDGRNNSTLVPLDSACPQGQSLIPSFLYSFKGNVSNYVPPTATRVPEPSISITSIVFLGLLIRFGRQRHVN
jgi:hypothetical protein